MPIFGTEISCKPGVDDSLGFFVREMTSWQTQDIAVVVGAGACGDFAVEAGGGAHALHFICDDADSLRVAADHDPMGVPVGRHTLGNGVAKVWIVVVGGEIRVSHVRDLEPLFLQMILKRLLQVPACVVGTDVDGWFHTSRIVTQVVIFLCG